MRRLLLLASATLLLGGCNLVMAEFPVLTAADARGAPQFRTGLWVARDPACAVDTSKPMKDWPSCASPSIITADRIGGAKGAGDETPYILAGGDPQVMQIEIQLDPAQPKLYMFLGVEARQKDDAGRIIEARTWAVQCGPPPPPKVDDPATPEDESLGALGDIFAPEEAAEGESDDAVAADAVDADAADTDAAAAAAPDEDAYEDGAEDEALSAEEAAAPVEDDVAEDEAADASDAQSQAEIEALLKDVMATSVTSQPLPGLVLQDGVCLVRTIEPLRNAARESLQWDPAPATVIYWVRDKPE